MRRRNKQVDRALTMVASPSSGARVGGLETIEMQLRVIGPSRPPTRQIDRAFEAVRACLLRDPDEGVRLAAARALTFWWERRAARVLLGVLEDKSASPALRGQAAEGIGTCLEKHALLPTFAARVEAALSRGLDDASAEVRFWCVFASGQLELRSLRPKLEALRDHDTAPCPQFWRVCDEAADVLTFFDTGDWPERERVSS